MCHTGPVFSAALAQAVLERLTRAGCVAAHEEAEELLGAAPDSATLQEWVFQRERGEPLAWITGRVEFLGLTVRVEPGVYVPRVQTEELALRASRLLPEKGHAVDLCSGTGAIAKYLILAKPSAAVAATDISHRAAGCCRLNGVATVVTDLDRGLRSDTFDVVTAVAPYVPTDQMHLLPADVLRYEPRIALNGGFDGLDTVRRLAHGAARLLRRRGWFLTEIGGDQDKIVEPILEAAGFAPPTFWHDEDGDLRGLAAQIAEKTRGSRCSA